MTDGSDNVTGPRRKGRAPRKHTVGKVLLATTIVLALATGLGVVYLYRHLNGNLTVLEVDDLVDRPPGEEGGGGPPGAAQRPGDGLRHP